MSTSGTVTLKEIKAMLDACAPGARMVFKPHKIWVYCKSKVYRGLPRGKHGSVNPEIEKGHVKRMARFLDILECAERELQI
jgi:hypothetical protein